MLFTIFAVEGSWTLYVRIHQLSLPASFCISYVGSLTIIVRYDSNCKMHGHLLKEGFQAGRSWMDNQFTIPSNDLLCQRFRDKNLVLVMNWIISFDPFISRWSDVMKWFCCLLRLNPWADCIHPDPYWSVLVFEGTDHHLNCQHGKQTNCCQWEIREYCNTIILIISSQTGFHCNHFSSISNLERLSSTQFF